MNQLNILQEAIGRVEEATRLRASGKPDEALKILKEFRQKFHHNNLDGRTKTLIEREMVNASLERSSKLHDQGRFREACSASLEDLECYEDEFDEESKLSLKNNAASFLLEMGEHSRAYDMLREVCKRQMQLLGLNHESTLTTQSNLARALGELGEYALSLRLFMFTLERMVEVGIHPDYFKTHIDMAGLLLISGFPRKALKNFQVIFKEMRRLSGPDHPGTLIVQNKLATSLFHVGRIPEALKVFGDVLSKSKVKMGLNHPYTLFTQFYIGQVQLEQGLYLEALRAFNLVLGRYKELLGDSHPATQSTLQAIEVLKRRVGSRKFTELQTSCKKRELERLHNLINSGDKNGVNDLLADGLVDVTKVTAQKGNTPLHMAVNKNNMDILGSLLEYAKKKLNPGELVMFIDAKTTSTVGNTAMHMAAQIGSLEAVKVLLKYGAAYNIKNKQGKTPRDLVMEGQNNESFLVMVDEIFSGAEAEADHQQLGRV